MSIAETMPSSTSLKASIFGLQQQIRKSFNLKRFIFSMHNNPKQGLRANFNQSTDYPYGWFKLNTLTFNKEVSPNAKNIGRFGSGFAVGRNQENATLVQNFYFPVLVNGSMFVKFMDYEQALLFIQRLLVANAVELLNFEINMPTDKWTVRFIFEDGIPFPTIEDIDEGSTPSSMEIEIPFTFTTKVGFNQSTAKINNYGEITTDVKLDMGQEDYVTDDEE